MGGAGAVVDWRVGGGEVPGCVGGSGWCGGCARWVVVGGVLGGAGGVGDERRVGGGGALMIILNHQLKSDRLINVSSSVYVISEQCVVSGCITKCTFNTNKHL